MQVGCTQVVQALGNVNIIKRPYMLQLNNDAFFDKNIQDVIPDDDSIILHNNRMLAPDRKPVLLHFMYKRAFVDLLEESHS